MGFSRQKSKSGLPFLSPEDLPNSKTEPASPESSALAGRFFTTSTTWKTPNSLHRLLIRTQTILIYLCVVLEWETL